MDVLALLLTLIAYVTAIVIPLILLPLYLERRVALPYNSVRSRLLAWGVFATVMATISLASPVAATWDADVWISFAILIAVGAGWDIYDMKTRRIPQERHPTR